MDNNIKLEFYKLLVQQRNYEGTLLWTRNQAFLIVNSLSMGLLGAFAKTTLLSAINDITFIEVLILIIGIVTSVAWILAINRSEIYDKYWSKRLRELEINNDYHSIFSQISDFLSTKSILEKGLKISYIAKTIALSFFITWSLLSCYFLSKIFA